MTHQQNTLAHQLASLAAELQLYFLKKLPFDVTLPLTDLDSSNKIFSDKDALDKDALDKTTKNRFANPLYEKKTPPPSVPQTKTIQPPPPPTPTPLHPVVAAPKKAPPLPLTAPQPLKTHPQPIRPFSLSSENTPPPPPTTASHQPLLDELRQMAPHLQILPAPAPEKTDTQTAEGALLYLPYPSKTARQELTLLKKISLALSLYQQKKWVTLSVIDLPPPTELLSCKAFLATTNCLNHPRLTPFLVKKEKDLEPLKEFTLFGQPLIFLIDLADLLKDPKNKQQLWNQVKKLTFSTEHDPR